MYLIYFIYKYIQITFFNRVQWRCQNLLRDSEMYYCFSRNRKQKQTEYIVGL